MYEIKVVLINTALSAAALANDNSLYYRSFNPVDLLVFIRFLLEETAAGFLIETATD